MFVEDCTRYREYIHLLSFNYDFHLWKAQLYLNGSQRIFNKGYRVTDMLKGLLLEYPQYPLFARNRLCEGKAFISIIFLIVHFFLESKNLSGSFVPATFVIDIFFSRQIICSFIGADI